MGKLLTISVAAYNVEQFLDNTLDSLAQEEYVDKLEVFVIDDGGCDDSLNIAKRYEEKYPDTFHAVHKENGGYGTTVNYSVDHATGKYFKLLDGDDWMDKDGLNKILEKLESCEEDVVITDYYEGPSQKDMDLVVNGNQDNSVVLIKDYTTAHPHGMWSIFYKTKLLQSCMIALPKHTLYTDQLYVTIPMAFATEIRFFSIPVYCYRIGRDEQSTSVPSRIKHAKEMFGICKILYDFYNEHGKDNKYILARVSRYYVNAVKTLLYFPGSSKTRRRIFAYEKRAKEEYYDLYEEAVRSNIMGRMIHFMRKTHYYGYWLIKLIPEKYLV